LGAFQGDVNPSELIPNPWDDVENIFGELAEFGNVNETSEADIHAQYRENAPDSQEDSPRAALMRGYGDPVRQVHESRGDKVEWVGGFTGSRIIKIHFKNGGQANLIEGRDFFMKGEVAYYLGAIAKPNGTGGGTNVPGPNPPKPNQPGYGGNGGWDSDSPYAGENGNGWFDNPVYYPPKPAPEPDKPQPPKRPVKGDSVYRFSLQGRSYTLTEAELSKYFTAKEVSEIVMAAKGISNVSSNSRASILYDPRVQTKIGELGGVIWGLVVFAEDIIIEAGVSAGIINETYFYPERSIEWQNRDTDLDLVGGRPKPPLAETDSPTAKELADAADNSKPIDGYAGEAVPEDVVDEAAEIFLGKEYTEKGSSDNNEKISKDKKRRVRKKFKQGKQEWEANFEKLKDGDSKNVETNYHVIYKKK
jgi:hypothetical protein